AFYRERLAPKEPTVAFSTVLQGKELSYNNILDLDAALGLVLEFPEVPCAVIIKHNTPCGVATDAQLEKAYRTARAADEVSAFGGIVAFNREVDEATARALAETFLEAVIAPSYSAPARDVLAGKKNLRLLEAGPALARPDARPRAQLDLRSVAGGMLVMDRDAVEPAAEWKVVSQRQPTPEELQALKFAWRVCKHVKSNAIVFSSATELLAAGGGQTSRVDSVKIAAGRGGERLRGSAVASDAFFPFRDGLDAAAAAGARCVVQPGGSVRDAELIAAADAHGLAMLFTGVRHFRH
ncbi:MAG: purH, partial [Myxococcaceae bacterium]|nr:purH [Myxococcaceae bacterium]